MEPMFSFQRITFIELFILVIVKYNADSENPFASNPTVLRGSSSRHRSVASQSPLPCCDVKLWLFRQVPHTTCSTTWHVGRRPYDNWNFRPNASACYDQLNALKQKNWRQLIEFCSWVISRWHRHQKQLTSATTTAIRKTDCRYCFQTLTVW